MKSVSKIFCALLLASSLTFLACAKPPTQDSAEPTPTTPNAANVQSAQATPTPKMVDPAGKKPSATTPTPIPSATPNADAEPPDDQIKAAVSSIIKSRITNKDWSWRTTSVNITSVEILRRGEFHPNERFFLAQVHTKGVKQERWTGDLTCDNRTVFCDRRCDFEGTNDFRVYRNDYGDWKVDLAAPWQYQMGQSCNHN
jgi:hypothetical protein